MSPHNHVGVPLFPLPRLQPVSVTSASSSTGAENCQSITIARLLLLVLEHLQGGPLLTCAIGCSVPYMSSNVATPDASCLFLERWHIVPKEDDCLGRNCYRSCMRAVPFQGPLSYVHHGTAPLATLLPPSAIATDPHRIDPHRARRMHAKDTRPLPPSLHHQPRVKRSANRAQQPRIVRDACR